MSLNTAIPFVYVIRAGHLLILSLHSHQPRGLSSWPGRQAECKVFCPVVQGWRQEFSDGGLTLPMSGLKYGFQGAINAKNLRQNRFSPSQGGSQQAPAGGYSTLALPWRHTCCSSSISLTNLIIPPQKVNGNKHGDKKYEL